MIKFNFYSYAKFTIYFFIFFGANIPFSVHAMVLERSGKDIFATGPTVDRDYIDFKRALDEEGIERIILVNGPGGDLWTALRVARIVRDKGIKTVVSGYCMSACSIIFMAGRDRAFGTGYPARITMVGIHGAHLRESKQIDPKLQPEIYAWYKQQIGERFDSKVINQALYDIQDSGGFLRAREIERNKHQDRVPWFCPKGQTPFELCQKHTGQDAYSLGIVTQSQTEILDLPESMKTKTGFFGRQLMPVETDLTDKAEKVIESICSDSLLCKTVARQTLRKYLDYNTHKAMAIGWGRRGYGYRFGDDDPGSAMLKALYFCNHVKNNPKLCRLVAVNDHELLPIYINETAQTEALLKGLPDSMSVTIEIEEPGGGEPARLRLPHELTGMTPRSLQGIERLDSRALSIALKGPAKPILIDVANVGPMLPGALAFINAGLAFENKEQDEAYAERFRQMLEAAVPDPNHPVVFYCAGSESWMSVNAVLRARQMGYKNVKWYRGGVQAWVGLGLPTVGRLPVAVIH